MIPNEFVFDESISRSEICNLLIVSYYHNHSHAVGKIAAYAYFESSVFAGSRAASVSVWIEGPLSSEMAQGLSLSGWEPCSLPFVCFQGIFS